jgi:hypothetical protein
MKTEQNNKKRKFKPFPNTEVRVESKKMNFESYPDVNFAYCKYNDSHYIFDIETGVVIYQGISYTDVRNRVLKILEKTKRLN